MLNYKELDKQYIEKERYSYYDFTEEIIKEIVSKKVEDVTNLEWRKLIQMLYPRNMIADGLFQPIVIFNIDKNGKRIDPPIESYSSITEMRKNSEKNSCLFMRMMDYIESNSELQIHDSWYEAKEKILNEEGD